MTTAQVQSALWKILIGILLVALALDALYHQSDGWSNTFLSQILAFAPTPSQASLILLALMAGLSCELRYFTLGKKSVPFSLVAALTVLITTVIAAIITYAITELFQSDVNHGLVWLLFSPEAGTLRSGHALTTALLSHVAMASLALYASLVTVYLYQVIRKRVRLGFFDLLRILLIIIGLSVLFAFDDFRFSGEQLLFAIFNLCLALIVYRRTKHSIKAYVLAVVVLFLL